VVQSGEREFHLRLDASRTRHPTSFGARHEVVEKNSLADPGLAAEYEYLAAARLGRSDNAAQRLAFAVPSNQTRDRVDTGPGQIEDDTCLIDPHGGSFGQRRARENLAVPNLEWPRARSNMTRSGSCGQRDRVRWKNLVQNAIDLK
jgi:hypothetical protein